MPDKLTKREKKNPEKEKKSQNTQNTNSKKLKSKSIIIRYCYPKNVYSRRFLLNLTERMRFDPYTIGFTIDNLGILIMA